MLYSKGLVVEHQGIYDFHTHSLLSDGSLSPLELIRRAWVRGYKAIAITDHLGPGFFPLLPRLAEECALARSHWNILAIPGVELTHLPPAAIPQAARRAKQMGAWLVVVHGESIVEPVENGTNRAAVSCPDVDILAHPGFLSLEEAHLARENHVLLEVSARQGHCLTNGYLVALSRQTQSPIILGSDAHNEDDLLSPALALSIARGAGMDEEEVSLLWENAQLLLKRLPGP